MINDQSVTKGVGKVVFFISSCKDESILHTIIMKQFQNQQKEIFVIVDA